MLSDEQIAQLAYDAGFRGDALRWAVAIAKAESGGNPAAYNPEIAAGTAPGSGSRGLWQIYGTAHPQYNNSLAFDPVVNARAAFEVYRAAGNSFTPWSTFNNGMASQYVNAVNVSQLAGRSRNRRRQNPNRSGSNGATPPSVSNPVAAVGEAVARNTQAIEEISSGNFLTKIFEKVDTVSLTFYLGGLALILIGLLVIFIRPATAAAVDLTKIAVTRGASKLL